MKAVLTGLLPTVAVPPARLRGWVAALALLLVLAAAPVLVSDRLVLHGLLITCLWAGLALSWNMLAGFAGQFSFGHAAFYGAGAYTMAVLASRFDVSPWIGMLAGGAAAAALAALIGLPAFRLRGPYFSLATLALAEVTRIVVIYWDPVTGGAAGLFLQVEPGAAQMSWSGKAPYLWLAVGYLGAVWAAAAWLKRSRLGYFAAAVREDQEAATVAGINPTSVKMQVAMVSAFCTGVGGAIFAAYLTFVEPNEFFGLQVSVHFLILTIIGGLGSLSGPVVGAFLVTPLAEILRSALGSNMMAGASEVIYGIIFLLVMIFVPRGVAPTIRRAWERRR